MQLHPFPYEHECCSSTTLFCFLCSWGSFKIKRNLSAIRLNRNGSTETQQNPAKKQKIQGKWCSGPDLHVPFCTEFKSCATRRLISPKICGSDSVWPQRRDLFSLTEVGFFKHSIFPSATSRSKFPSQPSLTLKNERPSCRESYLHWKHILWKMSAKEKYSSVGFAFSPWIKTIIIFKYPVML